MLDDVDRNQTSFNIIQHHALSCNMVAKRMQHTGLYSTMLEDVASTCWNRLARPSGNEGFINIKPLLGTFHKFKVIAARSFKTVVDMGS